MSREIKFRGKRKDKKGWVYGYLALCGIYAYILNGDCDSSTGDMIGSTIFEYDEVIPETVGQYTGLKDKNGKMIYDGDFLKMIILGGEQGSVQVVKSKFGCVGFEPVFPEKEHEDDREWRPFYQYDDKENWSDQYFEIIGNVFEYKETADVLKAKLIIIKRDPELLENK